MSSVHMYIIRHIMTTITMVRIVRSTLFTFTIRRIRSTNYLQCTLYTVQCRVYTVKCTLYSVQCILYSVQYTVYIVHCILYTVHGHIHIRCTLYTVQCTAYMYMTTTLGDRSSQCHPRKTPSDSDAHLCLLTHTHLLKPYTYDPFKVRCNLTCVALNTICYVIRC